MQDDDANSGERGLCFDCGSVAPFIIYVAGEDERPHEEYACEQHARGHWRCAVVTPSSDAPSDVSAYAW